MSDAEVARAVALFRYGLIAEFIHLPAEGKGLYARLREKAAHSYVIPGSTRTRVAAETLRDWLKLYRRGGYDALVPQPRADLGSARGIEPELALALIGLKEERPELCIAALIREAAERRLVGASERLAHTTVYRLIKRAGLMNKAPDAPSDLDRRRFAYAQPNQLWMSDVMHGPSVALGNGGQTRRKTYLIAFIDDATRLIPAAAFAFSENTAAFLPVFKMALLRRGIPQRLFVDNGANYRSQHLALVCAKLGICLIHARPYQPQSKGKQERWFRTVRGQLLPALRPEDTSSLEALNARLGAWIEAQYHATPHRGIEGKTPLETWAAGAAALMPRSPHQDLDDLFLFETRRKVHRDRTVSLNGTVFEVDAALIDQTVTLRFDPASPAARGIQVCKDGAFVGIAKPVDAYANCFVRRNRPSRNFDTDALAPPAPASSTASSTAGSTASKAAPVAPSALRLHTLVKPGAAPNTAASTTPSSADSTPPPGATPPCTSRTSD